MQFLASAVHALWNRKGTTAALIGPGDIDLSDAATRSAFFTQVGDRDQYTSVVASDIISEGAGAKKAIGNSAWTTLLLPNWRSVPAPPRL